MQRNYKRSYTSDTYCHNINYKIMKNTISVHSSVIDALKLFGFCYLQVGCFFILSPYHVSCGETITPLPAMNENDYFDLSENTFYRL